MRGKNARAIRKLIGFNIGERRKAKIGLTEQKLGERMGNVLQIKQDGTIQTVEKLVPVTRFIADEHRRIYTQLKKGFTKFKDSDISKELRADLAQQSALIK